MSNLEKKDVIGFSFSQKAYKGLNNPCYDHPTYTTTGLQNELVDTIPNIKKAIREDGMTGVYDDGVIKLFESRQDREGMEFIGRVSLTLVGGDS